MYSRYSSGVISCCRLSSLRTLRNSTGDGDPTPCGEDGDRSFGLWADDAMLEMFSASSGAKELLRDRAPIRLCLCLNFSSQFALSSRCVSGVCDVVANTRAFSRMRSSDNGRPLFSCKGSASESASNSYIVPYLVLRPHRKGALDVRRSALGSLHRRPASIVLLQVLLLLP